VLIYRHKLTCLLFDVFQWVQTQWRCQCWQSYADGLWTAAGQGGMLSPPGHPDERWSGTTGMISNL